MLCSSSYPIPYVFERSKTYLRRLLLRAAVNTLVDRCVDSGYVNAAF